MTDRLEVAVVRDAPLTQLLPRCDLVVCHAGWGTTIAALDHGIPVVCVPISADGFMNADSSRGIRPRTIDRCARAPARHGQRRRPDDSESAVLSGCSSTSTSPDRRDATPRRGGTRHRRPRVMSVRNIERQRVRIETPDTGDRPAHERCYGPRPVFEATAVRAVVCESVGPYGRRCPVRVLVPEARGHRVAGRAGGRAPNAGYRARR